MKTIKIANYSIYSDGRYDQNSTHFGKFYDGVEVDASKKMGFSIRKPKVWWKFWEKPKDRVIWVKPSENILFIRFTDYNNRVYVASAKTNPSASCLIFKPEIYNELKTNIPEFLKEQGWKFTIERGEDDLVLDIEKGEI